MSTCLLGITMVSMGRGLKEVHLKEWLYVFLENSDLACVLIYIHEHVMYIFGHLHGAHECIFCMCTLELVWACLNHYSIWPAKLHNVSFLSCTIRPFGMWIHSLACYSEIPMTQYFPAVSVCASKWFPFWTEITLDLLCPALTWMLTWPFYSFAIQAG